MPPPVWSSVWDNSFNAAVYRTKDVATQMYVLTEDSSNNEVQLALRNSAVQIICPF